MSAKSKRKPTIFARWEGAKAETLLEGLTNGRFRLTITGTQDQIDAEAADWAARVPIRRAHDMRFLTLDQGDLTECERGHRLLLPKDGTKVQCGLCMAVEGEMS